MSLKDSVGPRPSAPAPNARLHAQTKKPSETEVTAESLRAMCENVLHLLSTTVEHMFALLWPHLLEYVVPEYAEALPTVIKCCAQLAVRARRAQPEPDIYASSRECPPAGAAGALSGMQAFRAKPAG